MLFGEIKTIILGQLSSFVCKYLNLFLINESFFETWQEFLNIPFCFIWIEMVQVWNGTSLKCWRECQLNETK